MAAVREVATTRGHKEAQLGSAFTREEAAAGGADLDDEEDFAGETDSSALFACHFVLIAKTQHQLCHRALLLSCWLIFWSDTGDNIKTRPCC